MCYVRSWNEGPALWIEWKADDVNANMYVTGLNMEQLSRSTWRNDKFLVPPGDTQPKQLLMRYVGFKVGPGLSRQWKFVEEHNLTFLKVSATAAVRSNSETWRARFSNLERRVYNVERYCRLESQGYAAVCIPCGAVFARGGTTGHCSVFPAPNLDAIETSEDFFCHPKEAEPPGKEQHNDESGTSRRRRRRGRRCFLSSSHFFLDLEAHDYSKAMVEGQKVFKCPSCHSELGLFLSTSLSSLFGVKGVLCSFFHGSARLCIHDKHGEPHRFDTFTFPSSEFCEEHLCAWMIRKEFEQLSTRHVLLKSLDGQIHMLVWLLEPSAILACGLLDEDGVCPSMAILKLMFLDNDVDLLAVVPPNAPSIRLTNPVVGFIKSALRKNQTNLPEALTRIGKFQVSYLRLSQI